MLGYVLRRLLSAIPVLAIVAVLVFLMLRLTPGDPAAVIAGTTPRASRSPRCATSSASTGRCRAVRDLDRQPGPRRSRESFFFKKSIGELILGRVEPTLSLAAATMLIAVCVAIPLGVVAAYRHGSWLDRIVMGVSVLGFSVPVFVIATG